jgi:carbon-monoxide dehydrogenase large subunit
MARATRSCKAVSRQSDSFGIPCRENGCEHGAPAVPAENALLDTQSIQDADYNPLGIKGAGESGTIPAAAAIIAAIENALGPFEIKISQCPLQAEHIVDMITRSKPRAQEAESPVEA